MQGEHKKPEYLAISRFGQVPALVCGNETMCQSNRILEFLAETTGKFDGKSAKDKRAVREWLNWCDDRLINIARSRAQIKFFKGKPEVIENAQGNAKTALDTLNAHLKGRTCIVGNKPTIADISAYALVALADEAELNLKDWPEVYAWCTRLSKLPGSGHPYEIMPKESRA
jgi:glutathione S-transferase